MAIYKASIYFQCNTQGWSEHWYRDTALTDLAAVWDSTLPMVQKRQAMLAQPSKITALSVSFEGVDFDSDLRYVDMPGLVAAPGPTFFTASNPDTTVVIRFRSNQAGQRKNVFVRGVPDDAVKDGGVFQPGFAPFVDPANAWIATLAAGQSPYGWMGRTVGVEGLVVGYVPEVDTDRVVLNMGGPFFTVPQIGTVLNVAVSRLNGEAGSPLNRELKVEVIDADTCKTIDSFAVFPFRSPGKIRRFNYVLRPVVSATFQRASTRRTGKPFGVRRGRAPARPKG